MYKRIYLLLILIVCYSFSGFAQDMKEGFDYLEKGDFALAETFFKKILKSYPENKTAKLCYARATGLSGNPEDALQLLNALGEEYPSDFEIQLNYAEALLWNKDYNSAESYYTQLLNINNKSFPAVLGFANTLSSLKKYKKALEYVDRALVLMPENPNANVSKKYIQLGLANSYIKTKEYEKSVDLLKNNLELFPGDNETLLSLANTYIIAEDYLGAKEVYNQLNNTPKERVQSRLGLSLLAYIEGNEEEALTLSQSNLSQVKELEDSLLTIQVKQRYVQALIWNAMFKEAETYLKALPPNSLTENWVLGLKAMLNVYKKDFNKSIEYYKQILENDSTSFDGNLGLANAYKAIDKYDEAYVMAMQTLTFYEGQKDALSFINQLESMFYPKLLTVLKYSFDNGDNESYAVSNRVVYPLTSKFELNGSYTYRKTLNDITSYEADVNYADVGIKYRLINTIVLNTTLGVNTVQLDSNSYNELQAKISFDVKPMKLQQLSFGYSRELEDFNAELINQKIIKDIFFVNHNLSTNIKLGWFNQYFYTSQNDGNERHLYFTSLYYSLYNKPAVKVGVNYQHIRFSLQRPTVYFSPDRFNMVEVFGEIIKSEDALKERGWSYGVNTAVGYQYIEEEDKQATYRIKLDLGYKASDRFSSGVYYQKSNIASGNSGGFSYSEFGVKLKWILSKRSVFKNKKNED